MKNFLIFSTPIFLVFCLGAQMAYSQVNRRFLAYSGIPEVTSLSALQSLPAGQSVLVRGQILQAEAVAGADNALLVYQARPMDGREVRFREEFPLIFPELRVLLGDGEVTIKPSAVQAQVISHELHRIPVGDRELTGFSVGDTVNIQGKWQPSTSGETSAILLNVTSIHGINKVGLLAEAERALQQVALARNGLGLLTLLGIVSLVVQLYRTRGNQPPSVHDQGQPWPYSGEQISASGG